MSEQQYILEKFQSLYSRLSDKRIIIYGVGVNTKYVLENIEDNKAIVGLADAQKAGQTMYCYKVYSVDEIADVADVIIIIVRAALLRMLYERVKHLENHSIEIYNIEGNNLREYFDDENKHSSYQNNEYWEKSKKDLIIEIDKHNTISFDLFDTLLMRSVMRPIDVFDLVEREFSETFGYMIPYAENRIDAENEFNLNCVPGFSEIYKNLNEKLTLNNNKITWLLEKEMEIEKKILVPRKTVVECYHYAINSGKTVIVTSDMYYSSEFLKELLEKNGIPCDNVKVFVSNELQATKESGELFDILKQNYNNILHIGDNKVADIEKAQAAGIDSYYIMSAVDMMLNSPLFFLMSHVKSLDDSLTLGRFASKVLNNPFALCENKGKLYIDKPEELIEFFTPILFRFLRWFIQTVESYTDDTVILFLARDGHLMKLLYDTIKENLVLGLPDSIYFLTSREALTENQAKWHVNYNAYWDSLNISDYKRMLIYDIGTKGTSILQFEKVFGKKAEHIELICFHTFNIAEKFPYPERVHSYLGDFTFYSLPYTFLKYYELYEILSSADKTQFLYFDNDLNPVYVDDSMEDQKQWDKIKKILDLIIKSLKEEIEIDLKWHKRDYNPNLADCILEKISSDYLKVSEELKSIFIFESHFENVEQTNWWDRLVF